MVNSFFHSDGKQYQSIQPEVAGGFGDGTVFGNSVARPPVVEKLHYEFSGWLGDDILTTVLCFIVTESLAAAIVSDGLTGASFDAVEVTRSEEFMDLHPDLELPKFLWLKITGIPGSDDFAFSHSTPPRLLISSEALRVLSQFNIEHAKLADYTDLK